MSLLTHKEIDRKTKQAQLKLLELAVEKKKLEIENWEEAVKSGRYTYSEFPLTLGSR